MASIPYQRCEYLQSTGKQWIDTKYTPSLSTKYEICFSVQENKSNRGLFGSRLTEYRHSNVLWSSAIEGKIYKLRADIVNTLIQQDGTNGYVYGEFPEIDKIYTIVRDGYKVQINDGEVQTPISSFTDIQCPETAYLFAISQGVGKNRQVKCPAIAKVYYMKIWDKNEDSSYTLKRDFIPAIDFRQEPGMYDTVSRKMFYNLGTDEDFEFQTIPQPKINFKSVCEWNGVLYKEVLDYIYAYNNTYGGFLIDTDININKDNYQKYRIECEMASLDYGVQGICGIGGTTHGTYCWVGYPSAGNKLYYTTGNTEVITEYDFDRNTFYKFTIDMKNGKYSVDGVFVQDVDYNFTNSESYPFQLFQYYTGYDGPKISHGCKIRSFKVYEDDVLIRDLIPVIGKINGVEQAYFYNLAYNRQQNIGKRYYTNSMSGTFGYRRKNGQIKEPVV